MKEITAYSLFIHGSMIFFDSMDALIETIKLEVENMEVSEPLEFELESQKMTQEQYDELPEFQGF